MEILPPAEMLTIYGLTLMIMGALAYQAAPPTAKAMSSIYMGNGGAVVCFLLAVGARDTSLEKGQPGYIPMMICVHLAFLFPILYGSAVAWRLALAWTVPAKAYLRPYLIIIIAMSILTAAVVYAAKPKKSERDASELADKGTNQQQEDTPSADAPNANKTLRQRRSGAPSLNT